MMFKLETFRTLFNHFAVSTFVWLRGYLPGAASNVLEDSMLQKSKYLVVGLGNWGSRAQRHSVGAAAVHHLAKRRALDFRNRRDCFAQLATDEQIALMEPTLFMNENGKAVSKCLKLLNLGPDKLIVVHDDLDRAFGKISIKNGGSAGGHNGIKSTMACIGSDKFTRIRVGIGRSRDVTKHVLTKFSQDEQAELNSSVFDRICDEIEKLTNEN